jgi:hypothetical protein
MKRHCVSDCKWLDALGPLRCGEPAAAPVLDVHFRWTTATSTAVAQGIVHQADRDGRVWESGEKEREEERDEQIQKAIDARDTAKNQKNLARRSLARR